MNKDEKVNLPLSAAAWRNPFALAGAAMEYATDAWQRSVLYADVRRQRGNQYREHLQEEVPNVLHFQTEVLMSGKDLPRPVNYWLVRIVPEDSMEIDPARRPFVVVDPRAGHGPGIGGFKPDSEIGAALKAGHPCYFVGFLPDPVPGQSIEDVMHAEAAFVRRVAELHPQAVGKPAVIGNCQAGWQVLMTAAVWPELFGPIIVAGAPMSYWAGDTPMRYAGGLLGGSWLTALTSDVGAGRFDGAWLVGNFENLDPANTLWSKQYKLYAQVDTEGPRYLEFEKYWGGHVFLDQGEIQYIVDNLFIGNKLATAELSMSDGTRIDLRNIRSPIVVFCSHGDNITPPPQALGWITDLYRDDQDVAAHDQTIVYATHDSIGHLGIFVSGSVGRKEHREFASNIDLIDLLPSGIYRAVVEDRPEQEPGVELSDDAYLMKIRDSGIDEVRAIVKPDQAGERRFAAAACVSERNLAQYRDLLQPWVRALSTPLSARWLQALHPLRIGYEWWSDRHPLAAVVERAAQGVRERRQPVSPDNPFLQMRDAMSGAVERMLDQSRDARDAGYAATFDALYGAPALQALAGKSMRDEAHVRQRPGDTPALRARMQSGASAGEPLAEGVPDAMLRALCWVFRSRAETDERYFRPAWELVRPRLGDRMGEFRDLVRREHARVRREGDAALRTIPPLLEQVPPQQLHEAALFLGRLAGAPEGLSAGEQADLQRAQALFEQAGAPGAPAQEGAGPKNRQRK